MLIITVGGTSIPVINCFLPCYWAPGEDGALRLFVLIFMAMMKIVMIVVHIK